MKPFVENPEPVAIKPQQLQARRRTVGEVVEPFADRVLVHSLAHGGREPIESVTHIDRLGAHEDAHLEVPFFFQIERSDRFDASMGLRWRFAGSGVVSANALVPLNGQGLRPDVVPTVGVEWTF